MGARTLRQSSPKEDHPRSRKHIGSNGRVIGLEQGTEELGFSFVGPTTMYALMQSMGVVNDHLDGCHARALVDVARKTFQRPG